MESCLDLNGNGVVQKQNHAKSHERNQDCTSHHHRIERLNANNRTRTRELPPPIPLLSRSGYLHYYQVPWVLKRYYTADGRLIIREEKTNRREYFRANRENGRLILQLEPLEMDGSNSSEDDLNLGNKNEEEREASGEKREILDPRLQVVCYEKHTNCDGFTTSEIVGGEKQTEQIESKAALFLGSAVASAATGSIKCIEFNAIGSSNSRSSIFCMQVPQIRPVHS